MIRPTFVIAFGLWLCGIIPNTLGYLLAIDYGTDWTKALLVKPGDPHHTIPFDGKDAKVYASVTMNQTQFLFNEAAFDAVSKIKIFPVFTPF